MLGLPLAFILSQDQTLHRIILILFTIFYARSFFNKIKYSYSLLMLSIQYVYERVFRILSLSFRLAGAKVQLIFKPASFLKKNFSFSFSLHYPVNCRDLLSPFLSVREGKGKTFFTSKPNLFLLFFRAVFKRFLFYSKSPLSSFTLQPVYERCLDCGCKSTHLFRISKL